MTFLRLLLLLVPLWISAFLMSACTDNTNTEIYVAKLPALPIRELVDPDSLGKQISRGENRAVSFTNKRSAYFYTQSHLNDHPEHAWFRGLNIAQRRIFSDVVVLIGDSPLDPDLAEVQVYPDRMIQSYTDGITVTLRMVDVRDILDIEVTGTNLPVTVSPGGDGVQLTAEQDSMRVYSAMESPDRVIAAASTGDRHFLIVAQDAAQAEQHFAEAKKHSGDWRVARKERMAGMLNGFQYLKTDDQARTDALRWLAITTDQLVTRQSGDGIYAGLPWFNEYWGRDSFIALPGALLVTGEFEAARNVLTSFAEYQDMDPVSKFYGRVPNIVRPDELDYHTTDGTPRFINALHDYVRYSGDATIISELYPNISASIEGALANWTDDQGYLAHADNETWMDARRASDLAAYSPRDTRANDIQALWHGQLLAGVYFANEMGDKDSAERWQEFADRLTKNFGQDFTSPKHPYLADRLDAGGRADFSLRPNQFYAFDMISDREVVARATRASWENLVFPWGVASLATSDPFFHPYHLAPDHYHKDQAYHNGTVWLWNNGIAMQRMIELGQVAPAWALFENMNRQTLELGVVGGLGENMDAYPHPGEDWPRLTGTYLQAWSNTEQLRVWYQYFLGIRPDMINGTVTLAPRLPENFGSVDFTARVGTGTVRGAFRQEREYRTYDWVLKEFSGRLLVDFPGYTKVLLDASSGDRVSVRLTPAKGISWRQFDAEGQLLAEGSSGPDPNRLASQATIDERFSGIEFAKPGSAQDHAVMK